MGIHEGKLVQGEHMRQKNTTGTQAWCLLGVGTLEAPQDMSPRDCRPPERYPWQVRQTRVPWRLRELRRPPWPWSQPSAWFLWPEHYNLLKKCFRGNDGGLLIPRLAYRGPRSPPWAKLKNRSPPWAKIKNRSPLWAIHRNRSPLLAGLGIWGILW